MDTGDNAIDIGRPCKVDIEWGIEKDDAGNPHSATVTLRYEAHGPLADAKAFVLDPVRRIIAATAPRPIHFQSPEPFPVEALL